MIFLLVSRAKGVNVAPDLACCSPRGSKSRTRPSDRNTASTGKSNNSLHGCQVRELAPGVWATPGWPGRGPPSGGPASRLGQINCLHESRQGEARAVAKHDGPALASGPRMQPSLGQMPVIHSGTVLKAADMLDKLMFF